MRGHSTMTNLDADASLPLTAAALENEVCLNPSTGEISEGPCYNLNPSIYGSRIVAIYGQSPYDEEPV